jgi:hypothetical protein
MDIARLLNSSLVSLLNSKTCQGAFTNFLAVYLYVCVHVRVCIQAMDITTGDFCIRFSYIYIYIYIYTDIQANVSLISVHAGELIYIHIHIHT